MIKVSFEYTIINLDVVKVEPKTIKDESTTNAEVLIAELTKQCVMTEVKKAGLIKETGVKDILSNIGNSK